MAKTSKSRKAAKPKKDVAKPEEVDVDASAAQQANEEILEQSLEAEVQALAEDTDTASKPVDDDASDATSDAVTTESEETVTASDTEDRSEDNREALEDIDTAVTTEDSIQLDDPVTPEPVAEELSTPEPEPEPMPQQATQARSGGFVPSVLGGVIAAGIGFATSLYLFPDWGRTTQMTDDRVPQLEALIAKHSAAIDALQTQGADTVAPDLSDLTDLRSAQDDLGAAVGSLAGRLEQIESNVEGLASLASGTGADADALLALQDQITQQRSEIEAMLGQAQDVEAQAQLAAQRAALGQIQIAMDTGTAFTASLSELTADGVTIPQDLSGAAGDGVKSLAELQESFPDLARDALQIARSNAGEDNGSQGVGALLRSALGARSLEPKEGNDADAVLSRAEAALREERLHDVLSELQALPEPALAVLTDWSGDVAQRLAAISALQTLNDNLN
ncbi:COG4223 family protein [Roseovarius sp. EL26]|uniref:COG4223 family protein n=1 Tax=Roseovarius sp. EL26 TaxID=2126672 RepID=UPI000EA30AEC|nr:hypothetical protein [Roseovarius sp. EL26]